MSDEDWKIVDYIDAKPTKKVLRNKARACSIEKGIAEIVDNCIDYWREEYHNRDLEIDIKTDPESDENNNVTITWNMGVPRERFKPLLTPGLGDHKSVNSIGVWGEGFKVGIFALGKEIEIKTKKKNSDLFRIFIPETWINEDDWEIPYSTSDTYQFEDDKTELNISKPDKTIPKSSEDIINYLSLTFGTLVKREQNKSNVNISVKVNGHEVKWKSFALDEDIVNNFTFPPSFEPSKHIFNWDGLNVTVIVGLTAEADANNYGVYMYGMDRLFAKSLHDESVGFGDKVNSVIPKDHPYVKRLQVHIFFEGRNDLIPWDAPLKDGFNEKSIIAPKIQDGVRKLAGPYVVLTKNAKISEFIPYSQKWNQLDENSKKQKIFSADIASKRINSDEVDNAWKDLPDFLKEGKFQAKVDVWDHTRSKRAPSNDAKFDMNNAKNIAKNAKSLRDTGQISTVDLANILKGKRNLDTEKPARKTVEESYIELEEDDTILVSVRLPKKQIKELSVNTGSKNNSEMLKKIVDFYSKIIELKHSGEVPQLENLNDDEFLGKIRRLLGAGNDK